MNLAFEHRVREAAMVWLDAENPSGTRMFSRGELRVFVFDGMPIPLVDPQQGIRKPAGRNAALSILTTYTPPGAHAPYADGVGPDGLHRYKYRGTNPGQAENRAVRAAYRNELPLIWFVGAAASRYVPIYPVWVVADEPHQLQFALALDDTQRLVVPSTLAGQDQRRYVERITQQRLHQPVFRAQVLAAYQERCAICQLRYASLIDAAHILPDGHPLGVPDVTNGLALCKIHHAAFDNHLLGIRPDYVVQVHPKVQQERDGPMLLHGLQEMHGRSIHLPGSRRARPNPRNLEERYALFIHAL